VVFQPIVRLGDRSLYAYEALVRCRLAELSQPRVLFAHAVAAGCAGRLGRMIREIAVPLGAGLPLFLNVHPAELQEGWLVRPDDPIFEHDHDLFLEISESVPLDHFELCRSVLSEVRSRGGVHLVIDDLGAGTSNLMRIADLEPAVVKLDRELIANMNTSRRQQQMIKSVVKLCTELSAQVIAEGVETRDELSALLDTGAQFAQGYLFARPNYPMPNVSWPTASVGD
jgi:EAL domain-containing protein (putative c-di-GMP-specific phosphodiesterase class I)